MRFMGSRKKHAVILWVGFMAAMLGIFSYLIFSTWSEYKKAIIDNQKKQMLLTTQTMGENLKVFIEGYQADLNSLCSIEEELGKTGKQDWDILSDYVNNHSRFVYDIILEDGDGMLLKSSRGYGIKETFSVTELDSQTSFCQSRLENGEMYFILKKNLSSGKCISLVINAKTYYQSLVAHIRLGTNGYVVIKDSRGIILAHPQEEQWGIDVISGREKMFPGTDLTSLERMIEKQEKGESGVSEYYSYWWADPDVPETKKISAYAPANIGNDFLIVSAVIDYNDIYIPVAAGFFKLGMLFFGIVAFVFGMVFYVRRLWMQKKEDTEEIAYLTELNKVLEEMHQSEETIAHRQRLQVMGTMTGGIAHEFNNLLTPIMGYAQLLMGTLPEDSEDYDNALEIYEASEKAKEIIQQISSLSRKNMETAFKNIKAAKVLRRAIKMLSSVCPPNILLKDETAFTDECFLGNETQVNQVILNIGMNAIQAVGHREGNIVIEGSEVRAEELKKYKVFSASGEWANYLHIAVKDDGEGMSDEVMDQIFNPFFTTKKNGKGTGLGLSLVEQIIHSHKGYVTAESTLGKGSVFHIFLPANEQQEQEEQNLEREDSEGAIKLLVIDDNAKILSLLERNFSKLSIGLLTSMSFEEARKILKEQKVDVIVTDQYISEKSGTDFCMSLRGQYPGIIYIIMADRITRDLVEAKRQKIIDNYIDKPVSDTSILKAVKNCMERI